MYYEELHTDVVVSCLTEALLKQPVFWPVYAVVVFFTLITVFFCASVIIANRPPATLERKLTSGSVSVNDSDSVNITIDDSDDDDGASTRPSLHQFADVLCTIPLPFPVHRQDEDVVLTHYKRRYWRSRLIWGWMLSSDSP